MPSFLIGSSLYLQVTRTTIISGTSSNFGQIGPRTEELAALERLKKFPLTYNGENLVSTLEPLFLIRSFSFLQVTRTTIRLHCTIRFSIDDNVNILSPISKTIHTKFPKPASF